MKEVLNIAWDGGGDLVNKETITKSWSSNESNLSPHLPQSWWNNRTVVTRIASWYRQVWLSPTTAVGKRFHHTSWRANGAGTGKTPPKNPKANTQGPNSRFTMLGLMVWPSAHLCSSLHAQYFHASRPLPVSQSLESPKDCINKHWEAQLLQFWNNGPKDVNPYLTKSTSLSNQRVALLEKL